MPHVRCPLWTPVYTRFRVHRQTIGGRRRMAGRDARGRRQVLSGWRHRRAFYGDAGSLERCRSKTWSEAREAVVTRSEKDRIVQDVLVRYERRVGSAVVEDDTCLGRLLATLQLDRDDRAVGNYLCSFLTA